MVASISIIVAVLPPTLIVLPTVQTPPLGGLTYILLNPVPTIISFTATLFNSIFLRSFSSSYDDTLSST